MTSEITKYGSYIRKNPPDGTFSESEYDACLKRAFVDNIMPSVVLDSNPRGQRFLAATVSWGIEQGLLFEAGKYDDDQTSETEYKLTGKGRKHYHGV